MLGTKFYKNELETQEQLDAYSAAAKWCNENNAIIDDKGEYYEVVEIVVTLNEAKERKITELKMIRDAKELEPVQYIDHLYDFDTKSFDRINAAIIALDQTHGTIGWTTASISCSASTRQ